MIQKNNLRFSILVVFLINFILLCVHTSSAQQKRKILIKKADILISEEWQDTTVNLLRGNVILEHEGALMYCDSAFLYEQLNSFDAFGNIHINVSDTLNLFGDVLFYDGNTRIAEVHYNVRLIDKTTTLYTQHLFYDRNLEIGHYPDSGRIVDKDNTLTSRNGYYFSRPREYRFRENVVLQNPDYILVTDTLDYDTKTRIAYVKGPSTITGKERYVYAEDGWYDTQNEIVSLKTHVFMRNKDRTLKADSVFYNDKISFGRAFRNVIGHDTTYRVILNGDFAEYSDSLGYVFFTQKARALYYEEKDIDTLYIHADTLRLTFDTAQQAKIFYAFNHTKFYRSDIQGMSDSMIYNYPDSMFILYKVPVLWQDSNQMTADSIKMWISNQKIDSMTMYNTAFIIQRDDSGAFNQMRGRDMFAYFVDGEMRKVIVKGNSETVYYLREEDGTLTGINLAVSSNMILLIKDNELTDIIYLKEPEGGTYPEKQFPADRLKLKGFEWYDQSRPRKPEDIFIW